MTMTTIEKRHAKKSYLVRAIEHFEAARRQLDDQATNGPDDKFDGAYETFQRAEAQLLELIEEEVENVREDGPKPYEPETVTPGFEHDGAIYAVSQKDHKTSRLVIIRKVHKADELAWTDGPWEPPLTSRPGFNDTL
jgi:hypothetical protein